MSEVWRRAAGCELGNCIEVSVGADAVLVRDSKHPDGPVLTFTPAEWAAFCGGVRNGEFDA